MAMEWFRMYHGMPFDTKLRVVAKRAGQPMGLAVVVWACMLDVASQSEPRGIAVVDAEEIAVALDFDVEAVEAVLTAMLDKGMIDEDGHLEAWDKRQHTTSTERSKKSRAKKKDDATDGNAKQRDATRGNTAQRKKGKKDPDRDTDTDSDLDENTDADLKKDKNKKIRTREEKKESERRLVWLRAERVVWKRICWRLGCGRTKAWQMWTYSLLKIVTRLNTAQGGR